MRTHYYIYNIQLLAVLTALTACSSEDAVNKVKESKTPIELTVGVESPKSRASVITDEIAEKTFSNFGAPTDIWMVMKSEYKSLSSTSDPHEKDYKGETYNKYCMTWGQTINASDGVNITGEQVRCWDDAHARSSAISIWAIAVPGKTGAVGSWSTPSAWSQTSGAASPSTTVDWNVSAQQDATSTAAEDLCFSNNIADYTSSSKNDRRMKFNTSNSHFDSGKLVFYHALTKITVQLKAGDGFMKNGEDMKFDEAVSGTKAPVKLNGFNTSGTLDVVDGAFTSVASTSINTMYLKATDITNNNPYYTLEALVLPGTDLNTSGVADAISFGIDKNKYKVSAKTLYDKIVAGGATDFSTLEAGKNYIFTLTLNKTEIHVTATVKDWEDVTAANDAPMINVTTSYGETTGQKNMEFSFLRSLNIASGYAKDAEFIKDAETDEYYLTPKLYWPDHVTHYFFRGVWPQIKTDGTPEAKVSGQDINVENVAYSKNTYPSDLMLGYPRTTDETCPHGTKVATDGICATEGNIYMNFRYVMSQVEVILATNPDADATNKVVFDSHTTVEIVGGYTSGAILLQDGSASFSGETTADYTMHRKAVDNHKDYHDAIIPQSIEGLRFRITVTDADGKQDKYETVLGIKEIEVTLADGTKKKISKWEPGTHYTYTLTITKTGIKVIATVKNWEEANGGNTEIWM